MTFILFANMLFTICVWYVLMSIKSDTEFSWQVQKEINFELQAIRTILADTQYESKQQVAHLSAILERWDAQGTLNVHDSQ